MDLAEAYRAFLALDESQELRGGSRRALVRTLWQQWYQVDFRLFLEWVWRVQGSSQLAEVVDQVGTANQALRLLQVLQQAECLQVMPTGELAWHQLPLRVRTPHYTHALLANPEEPPVAAFTNDQSLGQFRATWASSLHRADRLRRELPPDHTNMIFCGDDDFTSLALANQADLAISVVDLDERVLTGIAETAAHYGLSVATARLDVREPAPPALQRRFHVFYCDPLDNGAGLDRWLARAFEVLTGEVGDRLYINVSLQRLGGRVSGLQAFLAQQGFALMDIERGHTRYAIPPVPDEHSGALAEQATTLGLEHTAWRRVTIQTDLLVFRRIRPRPELWPQDFYDIRRQL